MCIHCIAKDSLLQNIIAVQMQYTPALKMALKSKKKRCNDRIKRKFYPACVKCDGATGKLL